MINKIMVVIDIFFKKYAVYIVAFLWLFIFLSHLLRGFTTWPLMVVFPLIYGMLKYKDNV